MNWIKVLAMESSCWHLWTRRYIFRSHVNREYLRYADCNTRVYELPTVVKRSVRVSLRQETCSRKRLLHIAIGAGTSSAKVGNPRSKIWTFRLVGTVCPFSTSVGLSVNWTSTFWSILCMVLIWPLRTVTCPVYSRRVRRTPLCQLSTRERRGASMASQPSKNLFFFWGHTISCGSED